MKGTDHNESNRLTTIPYDMEIMLIIFKPNEPLSFFGV